MHRLRGSAAVRLALWTLLFASLAMALVQPAQAGTEEAPEIQDPANDRALFGQAPLCGPDAVGCTTGGALDVVTVWISNETATDFLVNIRTAVAISGGAGATGSPAGPVLVTTDVYNFHFFIGEDEFSATVSMQAGVATLSNVAANATVDDTLLTIQILKSAIGSPLAGSQMTGLHVEATREQDPFPAPIISDIAPDDGEDAGVSYTFTGGAGNATTPGDSDGDGLNDTCERQYFGGLNSTANATGDADGDGLTNGQECALGTDPTKADSDGDGTNDKDDPAPTDPSVGGTTTTTSSSTSTSRSSTSRSSTTSGAGGGSDDEVTDLDGAVEKLQSDAGYLGLSAGGFLAVLILCIVGLAVRWSL
jgi:hypothetical protein